MTIVECKRKIELESTGIAVAYCVLPIGHEGKCRADREIQARYGKKEDVEKEKEGGSRQE